ncbi:hypothetical protein OA046_00140 [Candidatus Pelagibacter sp.]|nr:hypothetical protein [Candidatus Pelagibacter sp.]
MKNNFLIFFFVFLTLCKGASANQFLFEASKIELKEGGKYIYASNGKAVSADKNLIIEANNFEYTKELKKLKAFKGNALIKSDDFRIEFGEIEFDQINLIITAKNNVKIYDNQKKIILETDIMIYDRKIGVIESQSNSFIKDKFQNEIITDKFIYDIPKNLLKLENAKLKDVQNNNFQIDLAFVDTNLNKLVGKDVLIDLNNTSFNPGNEPRLKGKSIEYNNEITEINKGVFTTCKKTGKCPPWQLSAEKITHNKQKKVIEYKNAWLNLYDIPIVYFPKFFHPDPTIKRRSGFLIPSIQSSNKNSFLNIPYFQVISDNKDFTFSPRFYNNEKILLQTEYRQANSESLHISDFSFFKENGEDSKNHFFYQLNKKIDYLNFEDGDIDIKIQKTSNDTYLRANKLKSPIIDNKEFLESSINLDLYSENFSLRSELTVYEDLNKNHSDRFEFILPRIDITKRIENKTNLDGNFLLKSNNLIRNYETNIFEKTNINELIFNSNSKITNSGIVNNYDFKLKNINSDTQNSSSYKENDNFYFSGLLQYNSSLPLLKENDIFRKIIKPKISLKLSPNSTKDIRNEYVRMDVNNIYNLDRLSSVNTTEGGASIIYGSDFAYFDKKKSRETFNFKLANNLRFEENKDLPVNNQIGQKTSDFFGEISYSPSQIFTTKYNASIKNNLSDISYENFSTEISINNFVTTFDYLNENNSKSKNSYLVNKTKYSFDDSNSIMFSTRKNKTTDLTEYYNFIYQYKNDCLAASIEYNKDYYDDRDIKPEENIFFKLTIIPFGETSSPNLKN